MKEPQERQTQISLRELGKSLRKRYQLNFKRNIIILVFGILIFTGFIIVLILLTIDSFTIDNQNIYLNKTVCIDRYGSKIGNVTYTQELVCSKWGLAGDIKCSDAYKYEEIGK